MVRNNYKEINNHLEKYWRLSKEFYSSGDFGLATFFAITLIEETSKSLLMCGEDCSLFRNHNKKYEVAILSALSVNSRVSRVYGKKEKKFAKWFKEGKIFEMRNKSIYLEREGEKIFSPNKAISKNDAFLTVCFAGEILAEMQEVYTHRNSKIAAERHFVIIGEIDDFIRRNKPNNFKID